MFYVYHLIDPRTNSPFYVGKGKGDRVDRHEVEAKKGSNSKKCFRIREIWDCGHDVRKRIVKRFDNEDEAFAFEIREISRIGYQNLTNATKGGRAPSWLVLDNSICGDRDIIRYFPTYVRLYRRYGRGSRMHDVCRTMASLFAEVLGRRGFVWIEDEATKMGVSFFSHPQPPPII